MKTEFDRLQTDFAWSHHIYKNVQGIHLDMFYQSSYQINTWKIILKKNISFYFEKNAKMM